MRIRTTRVICASGTRRHRWWCHLYVSLIVRDVHSHSEVDWPAVTFADVVVTLCRTFFLYYQNTLDCIIRKKLACSRPLWRHNVSRPRRAAIASDNRSWWRFTGLSPGTPTSARCSTKRVWSWAWTKQCYSRSADDRTKKTTRSDLTHVLLEPLCQSLCCCSQSAVYCWWLMLFVIVVNFKRCSPRVTNHLETESYFWGYWLKQGVASPMDTCEIKAFAHVSFNYVVINKSSADHLCEDADHVNDLF